MTAPKALPIPRGVCDGRFRGFPEFPGRHAVTASIRLSGPREACMTDFEGFRNPREACDDPPGRFRKPPEALRNPPEAFRNPREVCNDRFRGSPEPSRGMR